MLGRKSGVTQAASYLGHLGLSKRRTSWAGRPGSLYACVAGNCVTQLAICLFEMDVSEMKASAIKSLLSGTYFTARVAIRMNTFWPIFTSVSKACSRRSSMKSFIIQRINPKISAAGPHVSRTLGSPLPASV